MATDGAAGKIDDPLSFIERVHDELFELCETMEHLADRLPEPVGFGVVTGLERKLRRDLPIHHREEEFFLFPMLADRCAPAGRSVQMLERLAVEHATDEALAEEVTEALIAHDAGQLPRAEALGYMMRCFFECYRRHLLWENTVLLPLARRLLTPQDCAVLAERLALYRQERERRR